MPSPSHLIVGLGNPGNDYAPTRHNIGFMAADAIAASYKLPRWKKKFKGLITAVPSFILLKPQTFMNLSGEAVGEAMRFHKLASENVIVFHDELDLEPGQVKIKQGGGNAGHNGLKSIDAHIGAGYWRVRLGIGHPGVKGDAVLQYVLNPFTKVDHKWLDPLLEALAAEFDFMLASKPTEYVNRVQHKIGAMRG
jgi:PTH1 family peptidyl-tRNA hydrolase